MHLDGDVQWVQELELRWLLAGLDDSLSQVLGSLAAPRMVPAHHRVKRACAPSKARFTAMQRRDSAFIGARLLGDNLFQRKAFTYFALSPMERACSCDKHVTPLGILGHTEQEQIPDIVPSRCTQAVLVAAWKPSSPAHELTLHNRRGWPVSGASEPSGQAFHVQTRKGGVYVRERACVQRCGAHGVELGGSVGGELVDSHNHWDAVCARVGDVARQIAAAGLHKLRVLAAVRLVQWLACCDRRATSMHLQRPHCARTQPQQSYLIIIIVPFGFSSSSSSSSSSRARAITVIEVTA